MAVLLLLLLLLLSWLSGFSAAVGVVVGEEGGAENRSGVGVLRKKYIDNDALAQKYCSSSTKGKF